MTCRLLLAATILLASLTAAVRVAMVDPYGLAVIVVSVAASVVVVGRAMR